MQCRSGHVVSALGLLIMACLLAPPLLLAKGLGELAPKAPPTPSKAPEGGDDHSQPGEPGPRQPSSEASEGDKPEVATPPSRLSLMLKDRLVVSTSTGLAYIQRGSASWLGSGMSDIGAAFRLQQSYAAGKLFVSLRYAPLDVAPRLADDPAEAYVGILEAYLLGGRWQRPWGPNWQLQLGAELGLLRLRLQDQLLVDYEKAPNAYSAIVGLAAGTEWQLTPNLSLGPQLHLSVGSYTILQLGAQAAFAF